jgi:hypothetical protein
MKPEIKQRLIELQARAKSLTLFGNAPDGRKWNDHILEALMGTLDATDEEKKSYNQYLADLYRRAHDHVPEAINELRGLVITVTSNFVTATSNFASFFQIIELADNEAPAIVNTTKNEIKASYIGQDGENELTKVIKPRHEATVDLHELVSEDVEYRTRDLYTGDISEAARVMFDISFDLKQKLETILFELLTDATVGAFGTFDITNSNKARRVMNMHSRIRSGVLPTTNEVDIVGVGGSTKFGFPVLDEIVDYTVRFASTEPEGDIQPTGDIIVPAQDIREIATGITATNTTKQGEIAEALMRTGWRGVDYLNQNWRFIPDNYIERKKCYVRLSKPVGILWMKPGMADMGETVNRKQNLASRWEKIVIGAAIPTPWKKRILRIRYRT